MDGSAEHQVALEDAATILCRRRKHSHPPHDNRLYPAPQRPRLPNQGNGSQNTRRAVRKNFPVVCVGGSAGGLGAYIRLLKCLPVDLGVAVVIVNHITRFPTQLHTILPKYTAMPVELISDRLLIEPNRVFIIPENCDLHAEGGEFQLRPISKPRGWPDVITVFLRSLIAHWDGKLIAVIVSGYDGDGAAALCGIQQVGGITIAQKLDTAKQPDMPESAIATGCVDFVLSPEDIAQTIRRMAQHEP
jgi:chemotaxis response regulator CheB